MSRFFEETITEEEFKELYITQNLTREQIAERLGWSLSPIKHYIRKHNIKKDKEKLILNRKKTNLERYGVETPLQSREIKEKVKNTNLLRYGTPCSLSNAEVFLKLVVQCKKNTELILLGKVLF